MDKILKFIGYAMLIYIWINAVFFEISNVLAVVMSITSAILLSIGVLVEEKKKKSLA